MVSLGKVLLLPLFCVLRLLPSGITRGKRYYWVYAGANIAPCGALARTACITLSLQANIGASEMRSRITGKQEKSRDSVELRGEVRRRSKSKINGVGASILARTGEKTRAED